MKTLVALLSLLVSSCASVALASPSSASGSASGSGELADPSPSPSLASEPAELPDPALTPGEVLPGITLRVIAKPSFASQKKHASVTQRRKVFALYGVTPGPGQYRVDHLIPLALGGATTVKNLWPQPFAISTTKDRLETKLYRLVVARKVPLRQAQQEIARDWTAAYVKYVGPLPVTP